MSIIHSEYADVEIVDEPIHDVVLGNAAAYADRPAMIDGVSGKTITYAELDHMTRRLSAGLAAAGIRKGDVIALHSPNTILYPVAFYAATRAGATVTTVNALYTADELAVLPYSSGTTGVAKGVMLTHRNIGTNMAQCESMLDLADEERLIAILPFFHIYGMTV